MLYTSYELHKMADDLLNHINNMEATVEYPDKEGTELWYDLKEVLDYISRLGKEFPIRYCDKETAHILVGILCGQGKINVHRAHGRGVGYFYMVSIPKENPDATGKTD